MFPTRYQPSAFPLHRLRGHDHYELRAPSSLQAFLRPGIGGIFAGLTLRIGNRLTPASSFSASCLVKTLFLTGASSNPLSSVFTPAATANRPASASKPGLLQIMVWS